MAISSMTGFARASGSLGGDSWSWEIRSVNSRGLDLRCRLQGGLDRLEAFVRTAATNRFYRGNLTMNLTFSSPRKNLEIRVNQDVLNTVLELSNDLAQRIKARPPSVEGLLAMRGVVDSVEAEDSEDHRKALEASILATLEEALDDLAEDRGVEGGVLGDILGRQVDTIAALINDAGGLAATQPTTIKTRLQKQIADFLDETDGLPEDRLLQEAALLATKADVREELDRLATHVEAARQLLADGGAIGRRLDFLAQEFNREANTLCSKSHDAALTKVGIELKTVIDQFREQAQNIE